MFDYDSLFNNTKKKKSEQNKVQNINDFSSNSDNYSYRDSNNSNSDDNISDSDDINSDGFDINKYEKQEVLDYKNKYQLVNK